MERFLKGYDRQSGDFNHAGILSFDVYMEGYNLEEDIQIIQDADPDQLDTVECANQSLRDLVALGVQDENLLNDPRFLLKIGRVLVEDTDDLHLSEEALKKYSDIATQVALAAENAVVQELSKMLGMSISTQGHDNCGELICQINLTSYDQLKKIMDVIYKAPGGEGDLGLSVPYHTVRGFVLWPDVELFNGRRFSLENSVVGYTGSISDWMEENEPYGLLWGAFSPEGILLGGGNTRVEARENIRYGSKIRLRKAASPADGRYAYKHGCLGVYHVEAKCFSQLVEE